MAERLADLVEAGLKLVVPGEFVGSGELVEGLDDVVSMASRLGADTIAVTSASETAATLEQAEILRREMIQVYPQLKDVKVEYVWGGTLDFATALKRSWVHWLGYFFGVLDLAGTDPLLHAILSRSQGADSELLPAVHSSPKPESAPTACWGARGEACGRRGRRRARPRAPSGAARRA